jgi:phospholipid/cholesterol/gamma-HCH transport system ATP-binding protein
MNALAKPAADAPIVAARGIVNQFGAQRVHDRLTLEVRPGEILGIAGGSGTGKSVLLRTLTGLHRPLEGTVEMDGRPVRSISDKEKAFLFGVLFQQGALFSSLTVAQNVMLPLREHTSLAPEAREQLAAVKLALAGLPAESAAKFPSQLSGGMVKRAALARALALDPRIVFLDEPTSGLDPATARGIDELIKQLNASLGLTFVMVTHDLATLRDVCHRVALLHDGKVTVGSMVELERSDEPWIREFLDGKR